jgi:hypothetical protein
MERTENLSVNPVMVKRVREVATETPVDELALALRGFVRENLDTDYPREQLYVDLIRAHEELSGTTNDEREDALLDVMDFLTGWCAPDARIY